LNNEVFLKHANNLDKIDNDKIFRIDIKKNRKNTLEDSIEDLNSQLIKKIVQKINKNISIKELSFKSLIFRNQLIRKTKNLKIYNDSKCTNIENAILKNNLIASKNKILILGGKPKPNDIKNIIKDTTVLIFGPFSKKITKNINFYNCKYFEFKTLHNLLLFIKLINRDYKFDNILFSPGGESFDLYKDFMERGFAFNNLIKKIKL
jgi:UDP-N-acetylmuramoylalanine--D-glutamate ligase